jgi:hypothetical protein
MQCWLGAEKRLEYYDEATWQPLTPSSWQPIDLDKTVAPRGGNPSWRLINNAIELSGSLTRKDGKDFAASKTWTLGTLPPAARPSYGRSFAVATEWRDGVVTRVDVDWESGKIQLCAAYTIKWVALDGIRYNLGSN